MMLDLWPTSRNAGGAHGKGHGDAWTPIARCRCRCLQASRLEAAGACARDAAALSSGAGASQTGSAHAPSNLLKMLRPQPVPRPLFLAAPGVANAQVSRPAPHYDLRRSSRGAQTCCPPQGRPVHSWADYHKTLLTSCTGAQIKCPRAGDAHKICMHDLEACTCIT